MATATATIYIDGVKLLPYHIQIEQRSDWHHSFEITVSTEKAQIMGAIDEAESITLDNAVAYAGQIAEITIDRPSGSLNFKGYVTSVRLDQSYAGDSFIILQGYSPTYLLDGQSSVASFEEKSLKDIFNEVTSDFPANVSKEVNPKYTSTIPYVVRYKETQYEFLSRLANTYGEWFYYDGQKIVFGDLPSKNPEVRLNFGSDSMLSFNYGINIKPTSFKKQFYKYQDNGTLESSGTSYQPGWLDNNSKKALDLSKELFTEEGLDPVHDGIADDGHLKHLTESKKSAITGDAMIFNAQSADPAVAIGAEVEVNSRKGFVGKYRVTSVTHSFDSNRDYYNVFQALPVTTIIPPLNSHIKTPLAEPQSGEVVDNNDPDKLGRVRVKLKWQEGITPWVRVLTSYAGPGSAEGVTGTYFIPEIGDEVFVEFEQNDPDRPYVVGSKHHGSIAPDHADPDNNLKAIKTRSGHMLIFDDTDGDESILITDKKGNHLTIDTSGDTITINAGDQILIKAGNAIKIDAGNTINLNAGSSISLGAPSINLVASSTVSVSAAASYSLVTANKMDVVSANTMLRTKNLTTMASDKMNMSAKNIFQSAKESIETKAKKEINISATKKLNQRGGEMKLSSQKGKILVNAKTSAEIKGKQVKNN